MQCRQAVLLRQKLNEARSNKMVVSMASASEYAGGMRLRGIGFWMLLSMGALAAEPVGVLDRLTGMFSDLAGALVSLATAVAWWGLGMAGLGFVMGGLGAFLLWRAMRNQSWLDGPWEWCKKVRWIWAVLLVVLFSLGGCSSGLVWGAGHGAKTWVLEGQFLEKSAGHLYATLMIFRAEARQEAGAPAQLLEKDIGRVIGAARQAQELGEQAAQIEARARERFRSWAEDQKMTGVKRWLLEHMMEFLWTEQAMVQLDDNEAAALIKQAAALDQPEDEREVARRAMERVTAGFETAAVQYIHSNVMAILWPIIIGTLFFSFLPLFLFWVSWWLKGSPSKPPAEEPPPAV